ncbi:MAG: M14 family zinc carboxypeptidase [Phycisphaerales bacterium JB040]
MGTRTTLTTLTACALGTGALAADEPIPPRPLEGEVVVSVTPEDEHQLRLIDRLATSLWSERLGLAPVEIQLPADRLDDLREAGLSPRVLVHDVQGLIERERAEIEAVRAREGFRFSERGARANAPAHDLAFWDAYRDRLEIENYLFGLASAYPDLATLQQIGASVEGTPIWALLVTAPDSPEHPRASRPAVQWNAAQHAREWISPMTALFLADRLLAESESSPRVAGLLETTEFAIVPIVNPDGYDYTWTDYRFWRKNRRDNGDGTHGVDLNRNWSYEWGGSGSSGDTSSDLYRGVSPMSEPETAAVSGLALSYGPRFAGGIDYHSHGRLILWPWGYDTDAYLPEPERTIITGLSIDMAGAIDDCTGEPYTPGKATDLYPADGTADDWYQGATPGYGLTIELRTNRFDPEREHVLSSALENWPAALRFAEGVTQQLRIDPTSPLPVLAEPFTPTTIEARFLDALGTLDGATPTLHAQLPGEAGPQAIPMTLVSPGTYKADITPTDRRGRITWSLSAQTTGGQTVTFPASGHATLSVRTQQSVTLLDDDAESDLGWTAEGDATTGAWSRADPGVDPNQPATDTSPGGTNAFVTGAAPGVDVDGGVARLVSPAVAVPARAGDLILALDLWRSDFPSTDPLVVEVEADACGDWVPVHTDFGRTGGWRRVSLRLTDHVSPANSLRVRFSIEDRPSGDIIEAAVDEISLVLAPSASRADMNGDGVLDNGDIAAFVDAFLLFDPSADFTGDGVVDNGDIGVFVTVFLAG